LVTNQEMELTLKITDFLDTEVDKVFSLKNLYEEITSRKGAN
jgi:hypothetical protein